MSLTDSYGDLTGLTEPEGLMGALDLINQQHTNTEAVLPIGQPRFPPWPNFHFANFSFRKQEQANEEKSKNKGFWQTTDEPLHQAQGYKNGGVGGSAVAGTWWHTPV